MSEWSTAVVSDAPVARANPVAKLAASLIVAVVLLLSVDVVSAGVALALEALVLPWCGLGPRALLRRLWPVLLAAVLAGFATALFGVASGLVLVDAGPFGVSEGSLETALAIVLRVLAVGVPGVVLLATTDPTDLADSLAQNLRLPHRFVLGALAGLRLVGLLVQEWQVLTYARRARGVGDGEGLVGRSRALGGQAFALLVLAVRRGTRLAMAMEARGFGSRPDRTWARASVLTWQDALLVAGGVGIAVTAVVCARLAGTWNLIFS